MAPSFSDAKIHWSKWWHMDSWKRITPAGITCSAMKTREQWVKSVQSYQ